MQMRVAERTESVVTGKCRGMLKNVGGRGIMELTVVVVCDGKHIGEWYGIGYYHCYIRCALCDF